MFESPVRYFDNFIAIETYIRMTSMVMLGITMEASINKSLPIKGKTQAKLGHSWAPFGNSWALWYFRLFGIIFRKTFLDFGLNSVETQNNLLDKYIW